MSLVDRVSLTGAPGEEPEDYLCSALSVIFPGDIINQHGDADHGVLYTSPNLPEPLHLCVTDPDDLADRNLFSHFVWNSSLLLAKLVEAGTLAVAQDVAKDAAKYGRQRTIARLPGSGPPTAIAEDPVVCEHYPVSNFDVAGRSCVELGAGTALPSILAALLGATRVVVTDYPSDVVLENLRANLARNVTRVPLQISVSTASAASASLTEPTTSTLPTKNPTSTAVVSVDGHEWGQFDSDIAKTGHHSFDRIFVCDCLWMPWEHDNLRKSIDWFLKQDDDARCWVVGGFHTGRASVVAFFNEEELASRNLEIEAIWERNCDDRERSWSVDRGIEDATERKRWLVVAILRRLRRKLTTPR
ncbi:uncharacterized protein SPSK_05394 [Sporothrix schenckii 1099-18]|uniref:Nicotinamide N-methyltransferase n=1 Tax=Sporothrix schenckii 1099-18 TaxID=1397361 RepID=A0A0F2LX12_SPOSC|nr:uncharacterized protein SPSK_05394 [Sporothrix schenckii 1099-18]KJR80431.1 hypothetical protein SPSK_05394 [Sporothrix schenckii 1099-18]